MADAEHGGGDTWVGPLSEVGQAGLAQHLGCYPGLGGWWRLERTVQRPTSNTSGGRGAAAVEVVWSNRPLTQQARLLDQGGVLLP